MGRELVRIGRDLAREAGRLGFAPPVTHVYNPLDYASAPYERYLKEYGQGPKEVLLLGMNPGPFGMAQTGIPFGDVHMVRDWMGIEEPVGRPDAEHAKRPIMGFACTRSEVSGRRLWGWARDRFGTPDRFFARFLVLNYCPLTFVEESGRNRTPDKLPAAERTPLLEACDRALQHTVDVLAPRFLIGVGEFAERRARAALDPAALTIGRVLHPSPASPRANRGWAAAAEQDLEAAGVALY